jgi:integrase
METGQREIVLRGGRIILHTRADDRHGIWQCRLRLGADRNLVRRSTKTTDIAEAKTTAEELYEDLRYKQQQNRPLNTKTFKQVADDYVRKATRDTVEGRLSKGRLELVIGTLRRYLLPYFGKLAIDDITQTDFAAYDEWRLNYWTTGDGVTDTAYHFAKVPAQKTLLMEQSTLRLVFKHAVEAGDLVQLPFMKAKRAKTNRRSAFDVQEYARLMRAARQGVKIAKHPRIKRDRMLLELYVRLLVYTGARVGELRHIRWSDVELFMTGNGKQQEALRLWVDGKTGKRAVIAAKPAKKIVQRLLQYYGYADLDEARHGRRHIFEHADGTVINTFAVGFKSLLKKAGLEADRYGGNRTLYCLRHTYATFRLLYGATDVYLLSRNMGTSVNMIEQHYGHVTTTLAAERLI